MAKVLNNFLFTAQLTVAVETFDFAAATRRRPGRAGPRCWRPAAGAASPPTSSPGRSFDLSGLQQVAATLLAKDVGIMFDLAERAGAAEPPHVAELARATLADVRGRRVIAVRRSAVSGRPPRAPRRCAAV